MSKLAEIDWINTGLTIVSVVAAMGAWIVAIGSNRRSTRANRLAEEANEHSKEANTIAAQALRMQEEAGKVLLDVTTYLHVPPTGPRWLVARIRNVGSVDAWITQIAVELDNGELQTTAGTCEGDIEPKRTGGALTLPGTLRPGRNFQYFFGSALPSPTTGYPLPRPPSPPDVQRWNRVVVNPDGDPFYSADNRAIVEFRGEFQ